MYSAIAYTLFIIPLVVNAQNPEIICANFKKHCLPDSLRSRILIQVSTFDLSTWSLLCQENPTCCTFLYNDTNNSCVLYGDLVTHQKVQHEESADSCPERDRVIHRRHGPSKSVKDDLVSRKANEGQTNKEEQCDDCGSTDDPCVLYKKENITLYKKRRMLQVPFTLKPGMRLTVCGGCGKDVPFSALSVPMDPKHSSNFYTWLHIRPHWDVRRIKITEGVMPAPYNGEFPILDPSNFTIVLELTPSATKVYADSVMVKSMKLLSEIKEINVLRYSKIHLLMVRKTGVECSEGTSGWS